MVKRKELEQGSRFEFKCEIGQDRMGKGYTKERFSVSVFRSDYTEQWRDRVGGESTESGEKALSRGREH